MARKRLTQCKRRVVVIFARRWNDSFGNTYHTVRVASPGRDSLCTESMIYGYGEAYMETAADLIEAAGWLPPRKEHSNGSKEPVWRWLRETHNVWFIAHHEDVGNKRDL